MILTYIVTIVRMYKLVQNDLNKVIFTDSVHIKKIPK